MPSPAASMSAKGEAAKAGWRARAAVSTRLRTASSAVEEKAAAINEAVKQLNDMLAQRDATASELRMQVDSKGRDYARAQHELEQARARIAALEAKLGSAAASTPDVGGQTSGG